MGQFRQRALKLFAILLLTIQPTFAFGSSGGDGEGGGCGSSGTSGSSGSSGNVADYGGGSASSSAGSASAGHSGAGFVASEVYEDYASSAGSISIGAGAFNETINGKDYIDQLLSGNSEGFDPRLPGYSYLQGVFQADNHITVAGQVRVIGGIVGADRDQATANLYGGAMVTSNAHSFLGAGDSLIGHGGLNTRIVDLEEIPNP